MSTTEADLTLEPHRKELTGYCYRMLGSAFEADDAVQETMLRAWRGAESFEGRSSLRSWLYRIATNVCLDMLRGEKRRALPMDLGPSSPPVESLLRPWPGEDLWVTPIPSHAVLPEHGDPAEIAATRESVRLAFVTALQHLPPRQRAALILCEVLRVPAAEVARILDTTVASVNSALQRARATLAALPDEQRPAEVTMAVSDTASARLLDRYVDAFQRYDMTALLALIHEDAVMTMPPFGLWLRGGQDITTFMTLPGPSECAGSVLVPVSANGVRAWGQYKPDGSPFALQVHEAIGDRLSRLTFFLDTRRLFPLFGLRARVPVQALPARDARELTLQARAADAGHRRLRPVDVHGVAAIVGQQVELGRELLDYFLLAARGERRAVLRPGEGGRLGIHQFGVDVERHLRMAEERLEGTHQALPDGGEDPGVLLDAVHRPDVGGVPAHHRVRQRYGDDACLPVDGRRLVGDLREVDEAVDGNLRRHGHRLVGEVADDAIARDEGRQRLPARRYADGDAVDEGVAAQPGMVLLQAELGDRAEGDVLHAGAEELDGREAHRAGHHEGGERRYR
jgi:RNA polymerase sigma-70 factor, ECF subfamily